MNPEIPEVMPALGRKPRRLWILLFALLFLAVGVCVVVIFQFQKEFGKKVKTMVTSPSMNEELAPELPFIHFPAPKANHILQYRRKIGLVGYESWTCFEFATDAEFREFADRVVTHTSIKTDNRIGFDYEAAPKFPSTKLWTVGTVTNGTRATWTDGNFMQIILSPKDRKVFAVCAD